MLAIYLSKKRKGGRSQEVFENNAGRYLGAIYQFYYSVSDGFMIHVTVARHGDGVYIQRWFPNISLPSLFSPPTNFRLATRLKHSACEANSYLGSAFALFRFDGAVRSYPPLVRIRFHSLLDSFVNRSIERLYCESMYSALQKASVTMVPANNNNYDMNEEWIVAIDDDGDVDPMIMTATRIVEKKKRSKKEKKSRRQKKYTTFGFFTVCGQRGCAPEVLSESRRSEATPQAAGAVHHRYRGSQRGSRCSQ